MPVLSVQRGGLPVPAGRGGLVFAQTAILNFRTPLLNTALLHLRAFYLNMLNSFSLGPQGPPVKARVCVSLKTQGSTVT